MRLLLVAFLLGLAADAHARCIDHRGVPCRLRATFATIDYLRAPDFAELRGALVVVDLADDEGDVRTGWGLEAVRVDVVDFASRDALPTIAVRGSGMGARYLTDRARWGAWFGVHLVTVWNDAIRYLTPSVGVRFGQHTVATLELRSTGLYAASAGGAPGRSFTRDFDLDARVTLPTIPMRLAWRGRYRDIDTGTTRVRDAFLALGVELSIARDTWRTMPAFAGIGIRRTLARTRTADVVARTVSRSEPGWQLLAWVEFDLGLEQHGR